MDLKQFIESLRLAGLQAENIRTEAIKKYDMASVDAELRSAFPSFVPAKVEVVAPVIEKRDLAAELDGVRTELLNVLAEQRKVVVSTPNATVTVDEKDKFRAAAEGAMILRCGKSEKHVENAKEITASGVRGMSLVSIARECLENAGTSTKRMTVDQIISRSISSSTSDFPYILSNSAKKLLRIAYEDAEATFERWTGKGVLTDFKSTQIIQKSGFSDLPLVPEGTNYRNVTMSDNAETAQLETYGGLFPITRQMIYNDDLGAFNTIGTGLSAAAKRLINKKAYASLTSNSLTGDTMADGVALFNSSSHRNVGSTAAISDTTIGELAKLLKKQYDAQGNKLNIKGKFFLVNTAKEALALKYLSTLIPTVAVTSASSDTLYKGLYEVVCDAELDVAASPINYYLAADPARIDTVTVFYLNGNMSPEIVSEESRISEADGIIHKVRMDFKVKVIDYRGLAYNVGA